MLLFLLACSSPDVDATEDVEVASAPAAQALPDPQHCRTDYEVQGSNPCLPGWVS